VARASATTLESECSAPERALLRDMLNTHDLRDRHLEIGTAAGGTLKELIGLYGDRAAGPAFCVIDPLTYYPDQRAIIARNLRAAGIDPGRVQFWQGVTGDFLARERLGGGRFDFVFIDGDHRAYPVMVDLQWADLVNPGGFVCLHDSSEKFPGVTWAIARFLRNCPAFEKVGQVETLVVLRKIAPQGRPCVSRGDLIAAWWWQLRHKWRRSLRKRLGGAHR
jgi:hypothetical protein